MIRSDDLRKVLDSTSLAALLSIPESQGGLGWPIFRENAFYHEPEIAPGSERRDRSGNFRSGSIWKDGERPDLS